MFGGAGSVNLYGAPPPSALLFESDNCEEREGRFIRLTGGSSSSSLRVRSITSSLGRFFDCGCGVDVDAAEGVNDGVKDESLPPIGGVCTDSREIESLGRMAKLGPSESITSTMSSSSSPSFWPLLRPLE